MAGENHHFPTFQKAARSLRKPRAARLLHWLHRSVLTEWGLLRSALYALLALCVVHVAALHLYSYQVGSTPMQMIMRSGGMGLVESAEGGLASILKITTSVLGPASISSGPLLLVLCLVGLAASARRPVWEPTAAPGPILQDDPIPEQKPAPPAPARHPLDPEPGEEPIAPRWTKSS
jgi:hypothetical protein